MNLFKNTVAIIILVLGALSASAQSGASASNGTYLNYNNYVNSTRAAGGDFEIDVNGYLEIGTHGVMEIMGAVSNKGTIEVDSNGVLSIYGDMLNQATILIHKGATVNFYGNKWKNTLTATIGDGDDVINTTPGGDLNYIGGRPVVPGTWLMTSPYLVAYSDGNARQFNDGGNVPMDVVLHVQNTNSIELINTPTRISGKLQWDAAKGNVVLGNNDLTFTSIATQDGFRADRYAITSGSGHVTKENFIGQWIFPVGKDTGDYTPAAIDNVNNNTMHVAVQDYETSASVESTPATVQDGMLRTWNIYANVAAAVSTVNLQHNDVTNQPAFSEAYNFVTRWSDISENITGDFSSVTSWQKNNTAAGVVGNLSTSGTVAGSSMRSRSYRNFATTASSPLAFFTKSTEAFKPLSGADIMVFDADSLACEASISFTTGKENKVAKFQLQRSSDGKTFTTITTFDPKGDGSTYSFVDLTPVQGINYYRIIMLEASGDYTISKVVTTIVDCSQNDPVVILYPNPAKDHITLTGLVGASEIRVLNMHGRVMSAVSTNNSVETIDISGLPSAPYVAQVLTGKTGKLKGIKFIKF